MNQALPSRPHARPPTPAARHALRAAATIFAVITVTGLYYLYVAAQRQAWQLYGLAAVSAAVAVLMLFAAAVARRGQAAAAARLILATSLAAYLAVLLFVSRAGVLAALSVLSLALVVAPQTLLEREARRWFALSAVGAVLLVVLDLAGPNYRVPLPSGILLAHSAGLAAVVLWLGLQAGQGFARRSVQTRLTALVGVVTIGVSATVTAYYLYATAADLQAQALERVAADTRERINEIETYLSAAHSDVRLLSGTPTLTAYLRALDAGAPPAERRAALEALQADLLIFARVRAIYDQVRYIDEAGQEVVRVLRSPDGIYTLAPPAALRNRAARPYFRAATQIARGEVYVAAIELNVDGAEVETPHKAVVRYATPIYFGGRLRGIIVANALADPFLARLGQGNIPAFLVDQTGQYVYHPDPEKRWGRQLETGVTVADDYPDLAPRLAPGASGEIEADGYLFAYAPLQLSPLTGSSLHVVSYQPQAAAAAPLTRALLPALGVLAATVAAAMALASLAVRALIAPLQQLVQAVEAMAAGDLRAEAPVKSADEVGVVAQAFNLLAANLRQLIGQLEARVAERTAELEAANRVLSAEVEQRHQAEADLQAANEKLSGWLSEVEKQGRDLALLAEMSELLQSCNETGEAFEVIGSLAPQLFPQEAGALCLTAASRNAVEAALQWGEPPVSEGVFAPDDCWALRRGRQHLAEPGGMSPPCRHLGGPPGAAYLCLPLSAQNEALGVISLRGPAFSESRRQMAQNLANHVALALANLRLRENLRSQSIRDPLTGLFNRRYLEEALERELRRAARTQYPVALLMLDVDHFKRFNDTFGHAAGDAILRELGLTLKAHIRGGDIACRFGGEEFVLLLPEADREPASRRAESLLEAARRIQLRHEGQSLGAITISVGVAAYPQHGLTGSELLRAADRALYQAKRRGRNRVMVAEEG